MIDLLFFFSLNLWHWLALSMYLLWPLLPVNILCVCVDMCVRVSVGQSECQQRRRVQGIRWLLATAVPLVGTDPAGSLWVGEHKWRCVWGVVAANGHIVMVTTTTTTVAGHKARPTRCWPTWAIERTRKLYLLHYPWLRRLLDLLLLNRRLGMCGCWMGCVGRRQIERVFLHSQAHHGDRRLQGVGRELGLDWRELHWARLRLVLVWDLTVWLVGHQDKLQTILLLLQLQDLSLQLGLLLLQYVRLLRVGTEKERRKQRQDKRGWSRGGKKICSRKREGGNVSYTKRLLEVFVEMDVSISVVPHLNLDI